MASRRLAGPYVDAKIREAFGIARDDGNSAGYSLEDIDLPYDDGPTFDDEAAFVATAEAARTSAGKNRGANVGAVTET